MTVNAYRIYFCPLCNNPMEILDSIYYIGNCPNCHRVLRLSNHREYLRYTGEEIESQRFCAQCLDEDTLEEVSA